MFSQSSRQGTRKLCAHDNSSQNASIGFLGAFPLLHIIDSWTTKAIKFPCSQWISQANRATYGNLILSPVSIENTMFGANFRKQCSMTSMTLIPAAPSRRHLLMTGSMISMTTLRADRAESTLKGHLHMGPARRVQSAHPSLYHLRHRRLVADRYDGE